MMFVDASVMIAIVAEEEDGPALAARLEAARQHQTSPLALYEATVGLARKLRLSIDDAEDLLDEFLQRAGTVIVPITAEIGHGALQAFERFGRGRHPAQLNMGDCFAYACARAHNVPLLYKGDDFALTDLA